MGGVGKYQTTFPVIQLDKVRLTNKILAHYIGLKQEDGPFETVFRDLSEFSSTNGVESLSALESMLTRVDMSDTPVFEAFGLKFPADLATLGGIVILISVQVYLYIYLRRLQGTLKADDEGWDVAWIAMDSSRLARTLLFVTLVPVLSLLTLEGETSSRLLRGYWSVWDGKGQLASIKGWHWTVDIRLLLMFVALILSSWLGALCWKYRPRLNAEADAPQDIIVESPS
jgi:hypothetical protein